MFPVSAHLSNTFTFASSVNGAGSFDLDLISIQARLCHDPPES